MGVTAWIGLGSNLGDRKAILDGALASLARTPGVEVRDVSSYHETAAVGGPSGQGAFLNAAAALETALAPFELHQVLKRVEAEAGRVRVVRWGERTLDLDLLLFGDEVLDAPTLTVPHPRMAVRRFVLAPLAEITPEAVDPLTGRAVAGLLANLDRRPSLLVLHGPGTFEVFRRLIIELPAAGLFEGPGSEARDAATTDLLPGPDFDAILGNKAREWDSRRWPADLWRDRWIVTDLWFDRIHHDRETREGRSRAWDEAFRKARGQVLLPTFVATTHPSTYRRIRGHPHRHVGPGPIGRETPVLWPGNEDSRSRLVRAASEPEPGPEHHPSDQDIDELVAGILAACASR